MWEREPHFGSFWAYRYKVIQVESPEPQNVREQAAEVLLIKHIVLRQDRAFARMQREVEALENMEKLASAPQREPIAESVRLFVWQRDKGQCVKCASQERLEFDHIIPVIKGGGNAVLCEGNRSKGASI